MSTICPVITMLPPLYPDFWIYDPGAWDYIGVTTTMDELTDLAPITEAGAEQVVSDPLTDHQLLWNAGLIGGAEERLTRRACLRWKQRQSADGEILAHIQITDADTSVSHSMFGIGYRLTEDPGGAMTGMVASVRLDQNYPTSPGVSSQIRLFETSTGFGSGKIGVQTGDTIITGSGTAEGIPSPPMSGGLTTGFWMRVQFADIDHKMKVWEGDLDDEPGAWDLEVTSTIRRSQVGAAGLGVAVLPGGMACDYFEWNPA